MLSIAGASFGVVGLANAATTSSTNPQQNLVDKLASTFKLNKDDVQKVFDEDRTARDTEHQQRIKDKLDALVKDGKITQEQEDKLIAKAKELHASREANRDSMKDKTKEERKTAMDAERDAFKKWLSDNGISEEYGRLVMGMGMGHGPGGHGHHESPDTSADSVN